MATMQHHSPMSFASPQARGRIRNKTRLPHVEIRGFESLVELRHDLKSLDDPTNSSPITVVLALHQHFAGDIGALLDRYHPAERLIVTAADGPIPAHMVKALAMDRAVQSWRNIEFEDDLGEIIADQLSSAVANQRCVIFWPEWIDRQPILRAIDTTMSRAEAAGNASSLSA